MKNKTGKLLEIPALILSFLLSVTAATVFRSLRIIWVFFTPYIKFLGGSEGLFIIMLANIAVITALLFISSYKPSFFEGKRLFSVIAAVSCVFAFLCAAVSVLVTVFSGSETRSVIVMYIKRDMLLPAVFYLLILLITVFPVLTDSRRRSTAAICALFLAAGCLTYAFPAQKYVITSDPCVFDTGDGYSVVFSTSGQGTGYIEYTYEGTDYRVYAQNHGRMITDRFIHCIEVPYEHLNNNSYTIGGTKVTGDYSYGSKLGKTAEKGPYSFSCPESEKQKYLVVSDWHTYMKEAYSAISYIGDYDAVLLMGDPAAGMDFEEEAVKFIVQFGGKLTEGTKPIIYARGNHETRGRFAPYLPEYLGYDELYYTVDRGEYSFIVLDSGEDKEDSHIEYGGLDVYAENRAEMVEWLEEIKPENSKVIALSHAWQISEPEPELSERAWNCLKEYGVSFMISGHVHECRFIDSDYEPAKDHIEKFPDITIYLDGGHSGKTYIASSITLTPESVLFESYDNSGNKIIDESKPWN